MASNISLSILFIPPVTESYKIGNANKITIYIGANEDPILAKNKYTKAAVGTHFKTIINGLKNSCDFLKIPAKEPRINAKTRAITNPKAVFPRVYNMLIYVYSLVNRYPSVLKVSTGLGNMKLPLPSETEIILHKANINNMPNVIAT